MIRLLVWGSSMVIGFVGATSVKSRGVPWQIGQTVMTSSGPVNGRDGGNLTGVSEYLGIPYAEPPIGNLRFAAPQKFIGTAPVNATKFGNSCHFMTSLIYHNSSSNASDHTPAGEVDRLFSDPGLISEDCLFLNVWTKPQIGEKKKPVMVWIYGGAFSSGSSSIAAYNGRNLAGLEDVVVVSFNYRLNIFGFPAHADGTYNVALLDQRMAFEWVRDNIEKFGGDKDRIILFGQSAGAASIDFHSYAYTKDPIASGFILESGNVFSWALPNPKSLANEAWYNTSRNLECGDASSPGDDVMACMRSKTPEQIYAAAPPSPITQVLGYFGPTADEVTVFSNYSDRKPANVPMLIGSNDFESGLFRVEFARLGFNVTESLWRYFNLQEFTCPCSDRANASLAASVPTWRYRYMGVFPNLAISPDAGAWHVAEVPVLLDNMPDAPASPEEVVVGSYMRGAWAAFARNTKDGLVKYGWPQYDPNHDTLIQLGNDNKPGPHLIKPYRYDADCPLVNISSNDPSKFVSLPDAGANVTPTGADISTPVETSPALKTSPSNTGHQTFSTSCFGLTGALGLVSFFSLL
ncbi:hypothetical protein K3495_g12582 [Podosphaera aphanis]|nr:hypothetical protein K3495_g12582 [Podosphaera aphanis]